MKQQLAEERERANRLEAKLDELGKSGSPRSQDHSQHSVNDLGLLPKSTLESDDLEIELRKIEGFAELDPSKLPNALEVLQQCARVSFANLTEAQYEERVEAVANVPCRVRLRVVDVSANYDLAYFELLDDDDQNGIEQLRSAGSLGDYAGQLQEIFDGQYFERKGIDRTIWSKGQIIELVGLGDVFSASPWGMTDASDLPDLDNRRVSLRAFGLISRYNSRQYEFGFVVRNWYLLDD